MGRRDRRFLTAEFAVENRFGVTAAKDVKNTEVTV